MKINTIKTNGTKASEISLNKEVWGIEPNDTTLYDAITLARNALRQGTANTKTRTEVRGGGKKPWRQKGTGRARHGSTRSPIWVGGGVTFGPQTRSYSKKQNRKERRLALKSALSYKVRDNELFVVDNFELETGKTKDFVKIIENLKLTGSIVIVVDELSDNLVLATRNINNVDVLLANEINVLDIVRAKNLLITQASIKMIEEVLV